MENDKVKKATKQVGAGGRKSGNILVLVAVAAGAILPVLADPVMSFDPDCVLYYDFETISDGKVVNLANPGTMDGTIVTNGSLAPDLVDDTPAARIRQSLTAATYETSAKALQNYITSADSRRNGYIECAPTDVDWFAKTNFTIEAFFKTDNMTQIYTPIFRRKGGANVQVNLGIGGTGGRFYGQVCTNTVNQVQFNDSQYFSSGEWHHAALVADQMGETKTVRLYLDGKRLITVTLSSNISDENVVDGGKWFIGGANGGNSFDGKIDSLRVTLRALEPDEFLSIRKFPAGRTLAHVKFDDGTANADPEGGTMTNGVNAVSKAGGNLATFSTDTPGLIITDGVDGEVLSTSNTKSLSFANSKVTWSGDDQMYFLRKTLAGEPLTAYTVEMFFKPNGTQNTWARLITACSGGLANNYPYAVTFYDSNHLSVRGDRNVFGYADRDCYSVDVCDGKWHHVAVTAAPNAGDPTKSDVTVYVDYGTGNGGWTSTTSSTTNNMAIHPDSLYVIMGTGNNGNGYFGLIDELRISAVALAPSQFLRAANPKGIVILFK